MRQYRSAGDRQEHHFADTVRRQPGETADVYINTSREYSNRVFSIEEEITNDLRKMNVQLTISLVLQVTLIFYFKTSNTESLEFYLEMSECEVS